MAEQRKVVTAAPENSETPLQSVRSWVTPTRLFSLRLVLAFAAIYIIWGSTYIAIRWAIETLPPFVMAGLRFVSAGALLYAWARLRGAPRPTAAQWREGAVLGLLLLGFGNGMVSWSAQRLPSGLIAVIVGMVPAWVVLIEALGPRRVRPSVITVAGGRPFNCSFDARSGETCTSAPSFSLFK